ncbi:hypothetical protein [Companilactobacillus sp.]|jgi:hypothetical protein|uniref:hypothetical protein n=1 Tax=Companilactobacillus sp. TaxID=2767905 RepID=UPI0025C458C1|nr:hypothetical protein [Companilactobacillus sp.]MCH4008879.1 hypothetical protein [Companilactobacillus sp.]MCH4050942.1 hypothetical protein [Companilactobacillus sp.]MCH4076822.1 hypothetical protein [Companilactobacillus sp.]MCH4125397.1 hypothetical protein [Companilactobacillus sp.]MCH4131939.1 hypothetical protein [Companilactobacillus sp.]
MKVESRYFNLAQGDDQLNVLNEYGALALNMVPAQFTTLDVFQESIEEFKHTKLNQTGIIPQVKTIEIGKISEYLPRGFENKVISFKDDRILQDFAYAFQTTLRNCLNHEIDEQMTVESLMGTISQFLGYPDFGLDEYMDILDAFYTHKPVTCYEFIALGTGTFYVRNPQLALNIIDTYYEIQCQNVLKLSQKLDLDLVDILGHTCYLRAVHVENGQISTDHENAVTLTAKGIANSQVLYSDPSSPFTWY